MNTKEENNSTGAFKQHQKAVDTAINERLKKEEDSNKLDPDQINNPSNRQRQSEAGPKKTGGGKQKNPGM